MHWNYHENTLRKARQKGVYEEAQARAAKRENSLPLSIPTEYQHALFDLILCPISCHCW